MRILVGLTMSALMAVAAVQAFSPRHTPPLAATRKAVAGRYRVPVEAVVNALSRGE